MQPSRDIQRLLEIMSALRDKRTGCPWDIEQTFASIAPCTLEETYEVLDAITRGDMVDLKDELGDLLLQVVFYAQMASEDATFDFGDVVQAITSKLIRRHPHVFGDGATASSAADVTRIWNEVKAKEKGTAQSVSALGGVPVAVPAMMRAEKLQKAASKVGFDWNDPRQVLAKIREEIQELEVELSRADSAAVKEEIGDLLFAIVNLARHLDVDPEGALRGTNDKFVRRFSFIEQSLSEQGKTPAQATLDEMEELWVAAKMREKVG